MSRPGTAPPDRVCVLLAAAGEPWERDALGVLDAHGALVLKRCVDLTDLLATATTGQAHVAVVSGRLVGLDADAVVALLRHEVRTVAVTDDPTTAARLSRLGVVACPRPDETDRLVELLDRVALEEVILDPDAVEAVDAVDVVGALAHGPGLPAGGRGRLVAVWGPTGAPGRTTVATALAAERAAAGGPVVLVDADVYGGAVAQHLGVLDEVSGLLACARLVNSGELDAASFAGVRRRLGSSPGALDLVSGLPRAERWIELRPGVVEQVLDLAAEVGDVVVDCGFCVEEDAVPGRLGGRNQVTLEVLAAADEVVVVGSAEPTGLTRLARALVELRPVTGAPMRVVVNRMRPSLGWGERDITGMVEGYVRAAGVHFWPEDRALLDDLLVQGRSLSESGDSTLRTAAAGLARAVFSAGDVPTGGQGRGRLRRRVAQAPKSR